MQAKYRKKVEIKKSNNPERIASFIEGFSQNLMNFRT
jgi:hypothetical protein